MDSGTCRSGRTGSAPRDETFGYARGLEEGQRLRGEMRQPLRGKKRVRRNTERGVMVETPPASPFKMIEWPRPEAAPIKYWLSTLPPTATRADLVQLAMLRWRIERDYQELKDELGLDKQPLLGPRRRTPVVAVRGPHA